MNHPINRREFLRQTALAVPALGAVPTLLSGAAGNDAPVPRKTVSDLRSSTVQAFVSGLSGPTLIPGDVNYESSCRHWSGRVFKRPGLIVRCADTQDVAATVTFASDQGLDLAVRCGGHTRYSTCEGGVLINLSDMRQLDVNPGHRVARAQAGLCAVEMDRATAQHGLAAVLGECPTVGISGLTLGGGLGRLMGQHGALCDNVLSAELVTADGAVHRVNASEEPALFWAIRGGGGNFGVVTAWSYRIHPVGPVLAGMLEYPASEAGAILAFLKDYMPDAPDELDLLIEIGRNVLQYAPEAKDPTVVICVCCAGDMVTAEKTLRPLRAFRSPAVDTIRAMPYVQAQVLGDVSPLLRHGPPRYAGYHQSGFLAQFHDAALEQILAHCENPPFPSWSLALDHYMHGQVCRVPDQATAFNLRQGGFCFRTTAFQAGEGPPERAQAWVRDLNAALKPYSGDAMYLNYLTDQGQTGVRASFGANYPRLARLKKKVDPHNLFHLNPNITPEKVL
jgi:FAD/FMN-containing dehydrogenase